MATVAVIILGILGLAGAIYTALRRAGRQDAELQVMNDILEIERIRRAAQDKREAEDRAARKLELDHAVKETARDRDAARAAQLLRAQIARLRSR